LAGVEPVQQMRLRGAVRALGDQPSHRD
jgi:hypothetical protein